MHIFELKKVDFNLFVCSLFCGNEYDNDEMIIRLKLFVGDLNMTCFSIQYVKFIKKNLKFENILFHFSSFYFFPTKSPVKFNSCSVLLHVTKYVPSKDQKYFEEHLLTSVFSKKIRFSKTDLFQDNQFRKLRHSNSNNNY